MYVCAKKWMKKLHWKMWHLSKYCEREKSVKKTDVSFGKGEKKIWKLLDEWKKYSRFDSMMNNNEKFTQTLTMKKFFKDTTQTNKMKMNDRKKQKTVFINNRQ